MCKHENVQMKKMQKNGRCTNNRVTGAQGSSAHAESEGLKKNRNIQCITACCWATDWTEWPLTTAKAPTMGTWASKRNHGAIKKKNTHCYILLQKIVTEQVQPFMANVFPNSSSLFQQNDASGHTANIRQERFEEHDKHFMVLTWPPNM